VPVVELRLVPEEDHAMGEQGLADRLHALRREPGAQLHAENLRADPAAQTPHAQCRLG